MSRTSRFLFAALFLPAIAGAAAWWWFQGRPRPLPEGLIQANGRIEGDELLVSTKVAGRVVALKAREGDSVARGQVVALLDDATARARVTQAERAVEVAEARLAAARTELAALRERVPLQVASARAALEHARADLVSVAAEKAQAGRDARRMRRLRQAGTVDAHTAEEAELKWKVAKAHLKTAEAAVIQAKKALAEAQVGDRSIQAKADAVTALKAEVERARAALAEARSVLADFTLKAPGAGVVTTRYVDPGEVLAPGAPLFTLVDLDRLYLQVYVPERQIGRVRLGLPAHIHTDAFPDEPFPARVRYIASRAEFTPREVQTPDERVKLVYAVRLYLEANPGHRLTPGLPADAVIRWRPDAPWAPPRW